jgi:hypothetical protein
MNQMIQANIKEVVTMTRKKKNKKYTKRSIPTSKMIGLITAIAVIIIVIYTMTIIATLSNKAIDMGISPDFTPLNTLIGGALALAVAYIGFYINMAKAEHIEDKKNEIAREIKRIEKNGITNEEQEKLMELRCELEGLNGELEEIKMDDTQIDIKSFL